MCYRPLIRPRVRCPARDGKVLRHPSSEAFSAPGALLSELQPQVIKERRHTLLRHLGALLERGFELGFGQRFWAHPAECKRQQDGSEGFQSNEVQQLNRGSLVGKLNVFANL